MMENFDIGKDLQRAFDDGYREAVEDFRKEAVEDLRKNEYKNEDKKCECYKCGLKDKCQYKDKYQRLPRSVPGALGLCKKL